ncbi:MAG: M20/M25/M40 family metallo-hydrolase [Acidobacteria bacterium]|nr:M20/M25/M40 family metallo-hydrolase [Acidobacteriota bacterium]
MRRVLVVAATTLLATAAVRAADDIASRWWAHVEALANDGMEGRNTGSAGHKRAAEYVAAQFQKAALEPAGAAGGFIQPVQFNTRRIDEAKSSLALVKDGADEKLTLGDDANISMRVDPAATIDAPLVFVGYGLKIPERGIDDFAGVNLNGAVVVHISATPSSLPGPLQAHYGSAGERWKMYKAAGAIGTVSIANPKSMDIPWARSTLARLQPAMSLADAALSETAGQQLSVTMNPAHADKLFGGSGHTFAELLALVDGGKPLPSFALKPRLKARVTVERAEVESQNIAGILRGSDPQLRNEYVVLSAHVDHLGIGGAINGDTIYNGAMDNASGVAAMLEVAAALHASAAKPKRSILFVAVTGEEKGELGSLYFASHPPVPQERIVANVNTDMFLPLFPLKTLMVLGLDESDLGQDIRATARELGLEVQADPEPQRNRFVRSDQYSFIKFGIPALAMKVGYQANSPEAAIAAKWTAERYHAPSDDLNQPVDRTAAAKYIDVVKNLAVRIANRSDRPKWNDTSFFARFARAGN